MNSNSILQSNLLDIIFENRNKDYGAYSLRKFYDDRMRMAVMLMIAMVIFFSLFLSFWGSTKSLIKKPFVFVTNDYHPVNLKNKLAAFSLPAKQKENKNQKKQAEPTTPQIVNDKNINNIIASKNPPVASNLIISGNEELLSGKDQGLEMNPIAGAIKMPVVETKYRETEILKSAEIMPQFPGGVKALLAYLKKNIQAPDEIVEGNEISVKVKFVVNYNGQLESFKVIESGGKVFDNEVLRVLKKMPLWIPGKSNGENVSVFFVVPVRFTSSF
jgi:protein TonB